MYFKIHEYIMQVNICVYLSLLHELKETRRPITPTAMSTQIIAKKRQLINSEIFTEKKKKNSKKKR